MAIGRIVKPHGIRGEVSVQILTEFPDRFTNMESVQVGDMRQGEQFQVETIRWHRDNVLVKFAHIPDRTAAEQLRGLYLQIPVSEARPLEPGSYYQYQLEGLQVVTDDGEVLGRVSRILETGANDVFLVEGEGGELLLPSIPEVILDIDLDQGQMRVHLLEGLR